MTDSATTPLKLTINPPIQSAPPPAFWSGEAPSFKDVLDTVNPLQHIPIISTIYQALTGDAPSAGASIIGGAIFGGPIGLIASVFDTILQQETGKGVTGNLLAAVTGEEVPALHPKNETQLAMNAPPDHLGANQRAAYNAYVNASMLA